MGSDAPERLLKVTADECEWLAERLGLMRSNAEFPILVGFIKKLASIELREYRDGAAILVEDEDGRGLFVLRSGAVRVRSGERAGKTFAELAPGALFGEVAFLSGMRRTATVEAVGTTRVFHLDHAELDGLLRGHAALQERLRELARRRIRDRSAKLKDGGV